MRRNNDYRDGSRFRTKVKREYELFKFEMLSGSRREIYDRCNKIRFYESVYEYFLYKEVLDENLVAEGIKTGNLLESLYRLYLKYEWYDVSSWEQIEELLEKFLAVSRDEKENLMEV